MSLTALTLPRRIVSTSGWGRVVRHCSSGTPASSSSSSSQPVVKGKWVDPNCTVPAAGAGAGAGDEHDGAPLWSSLEPGTPLRVVMYGSDGIAATTLAAMAESMAGSGSHPGIVSRLELVSPPDKMFRGKPTPVPTKVVAQEYGLTVHELPPDVKTLKGWQPPYSLDAVGAEFDVGVVVSFGYLLRPHVLTPLPYGAINMHPSLLPKYRGPCPIQHALLNGDSHTGVSIIDIDPFEFDIGNLLSSTQTDIHTDDTYATLSSRLAEMGAAAVLDVLADVRGARIGSTVQDEAYTSKAPFISSAQRNVNWTAMTRSRVYNLYRAVGSRAALYTYLDPETGGSGERVVLRKLAPPEKGVRGGPALAVSPLESVTGPGDEDPAPAKSEAVLSRRHDAGSVWYDTSANALWVKCCDQWLQVLELSVAGTKVTSVADFANGFMKTSRRTIKFTTVGGKN